MKQIAKCVLIDDDGYHLMMYRSNHPTFGEDPDLPGGTLEDGENLLEAMIREVEEEIGFLIPEGEAIEHLYEGTDYSHHGSQYGLFVHRVASRPEISISWEHSSYEWMEKDRFIAIAASANDTFMHMVAEVIARHEV